MPGPTGRKILVVGGAGYVGSSVTAWLLRRGHSVHVLDDLSTGHPEAIAALGLENDFTPARAGDEKAVGALLDRVRFDGVMHFAASALVAESVADPEKYRVNNVEQTRALVKILLERGMGRLVFSSTCAVFGDPGTESISESLPKKPLNPYGRSKLEAERMLSDQAAARGLHAIALRYFNAAGAESGLRVGEWHDPETHLIPNALKAAHNGTEMQVFGNDYSTVDGTCVRDYVHVEDLARAHEAALERMLGWPQGAGRFEAFNLGSENGYSVLEIVAAAEKLSGLKTRILNSPRRPGDPPRLVADSTLALKELGFKAEHDLHSILTSANAWEGKRRALRPAVFLDRDGTINHDPGYLSQPDQMTLLPGVGAALTDLKRAGYLLVVVSNQSGVGRGLIDEKNMARIHKRLAELLLPFGAKLDHYELCFHLPDAKCACRKPQPKLLLDAATKYGIDLTRSWMIGDKVSDVECGHRAGLRGSALVRTGEGTASERVLAPGRATFIEKDLAAAVQRILKTP